MDNLRINQEEYIMKYDLVYIDKNGSRAALVCGISKKEAETERTKYMEVFDDIESDYDITPSTN